jgi:MOSC domain-containing protein YiiM
MAIIQKTDVAGTVTATLTHPGCPDGIDDAAVDISTRAQDRLTLTFDGITGDSHAGRTRAADVRVKQQYEDGTPIRNVRQVTIVSDEDLAEIARALGVPSLDPAWLGANVAVSGIPDFTLIPPSTRLIFESGASLVVDAENEPCLYPGREIEKRHPGRGRAFPKKAINKRGVTAWVEREGAITVGDTVAVHIPPQRIWEPGA